MTPKILTSRWAVTLLAVWLMGGLAAQAQQQRTTGRTGTGSTGGGGGSPQARPSSGSGGGNSTVDYPNNTLPGDATVSIDPETHSLIIMTDDSTFAHISTVVSNLDRPKPQVLIKVVFLEVQHDDALDLGVEGTYHHNFNPASGVTNFSGTNSFGLLGNLLPGGQQIGQTTTPPGAGLYSILGNDFTATVRAISSAGKVEVLSRPSILVRNNQPATITVGQSVPLVTGVTFPSTTSGPVSSISYQNIGIILQVTPFISSDGLVEMIVAPQISSLSAQTVSIGANQTAPIIDLRSATTVVVTPDGQTVIIGGLMETDKTVINSKIPLLGDIPLLGALFRHKQQANTKKELLIFLTPHVVNMPGQLASITASDTKNSELSNKAFSEQEMDKYFDRLPVKPHTVWDSPAKAGQ